MLITSISGIRGTIGGVPGEHLTPVDIVSFVSAYGSWILSKTQTSSTIIVGRDARISGEMVLNLTINTLTSLGINVVNLNLATTPTVEMEVVSRGAAGAIIITASHNPKEYNGLKMLNEHGEFLSSEEGQEILTRAQNKNYSYADVDHLGIVEVSQDHTERHIEKICELNLVTVEAIRAKQYTAVVDAVNSVGGIAVPTLLRSLGVHVIELYCEPHGDFGHVPEPLEKNLADLKQAVIDNTADIGIAVDPDVDRLVLVDEQGNMFGEEYTIVSVADYVLSKNPGATVSNLSSSRALRDISEKYEQQYYASAVGEKNVVEKMKEVGAVIGGEGSGGVIYPLLHYGRDALVGIGLFLSHLAEQNIFVSQLRATYPNYYMAKEKVDLVPGIDVDAILEHMLQTYQSENISDIDGVKIDFEDSWVHLRKSNTEPIIRIYTEARSQEEADALAQRFVSEISN